jgi:hypothetical protein
MKKYRVIASMNEHLELEIEAKNEEDAWKIAQETDGSHFRKMEGGDFWIDTIYEIDHIHTEEDE